MVRSLILFEVNIYENLTRINKQDYLFEDIQIVIKVNCNCFTDLNIIKEWGCFAMEIMGPRCPCAFLRKQDAGARCGGKEEAALIVRSSEFGVGDRGIGISPSSGLTLLLSDFL